MLLFRWTLHFFTLPQTFFCSLIPIPYCSISYPIKVDIFMLFTPFETKLLEFNILSSIKSRLCADNSCKTVTTRVIQNVCNTLNLYFPTDFSLEYTLPLTLRCVFWGFKFHQPPGVRAMIL
jgi:hypothetical protein